ncbi:hypothetical protein ACX0GZ_02070 [Sphingomonas aestuarii]
MPITGRLRHIAVSRNRKGKAMAAASTPTGTPSPTPPPAFWNGWRIARWTVVAGLLLLPAVAMRFTSEVNWTPRDFIFASVMIGGTALLYDIAVLTRTTFAYRGGVALALAASFLLIWINGAVGIIGNEDNPANLMFGGPLAIAFLGALLSRFRPRGMACTMTTAAIAQIAVGVAALAMGILIPFVTLFFTALWWTSSMLFRRALM